MKNFLFSICILFSLNGFSQQTNSHLSGTRYVGVSTLSTSGDKTYLDGSTPYPLSIELHNDFTFTFDEQRTLGHKITTGTYVISNDMLTLTLSFDDGTIKQFGMQKLDEFMFKFTAGKRIYYMLKMNLVL